MHYFQYESSTFQNTNQLLIWVSLFFSILRCFLRLENLLHFFVLPLPIFNLLYTSHQNFHDIQVYLPLVVLPCYCLSFRRENLLYFLFLLNFPITETFMPIASGITGILCSSFIIPSPFNSVWSSSRQLSSLMFPSIYFTNLKPRDQIKLLTVFSSIVLSTSKSFVLFSTSSPAFKLLFHHTIILYLQLACSLFIYFIQSFFSL